MVEVFEGLSLAAPRDQEELPSVHLAVLGDTARAGGFWHGLQWNIQAEVEDESSARVQVNCTTCPGRRIELVADITVHVLHWQHFWTEVQAVAAALLWSRLRAGWLSEDEN